MPSGRSTLALGQARTSTRQGQHRQPIQCQTSGSLVFAVGFAALDRQRTYVIGPDPDRAGAKIAFQMVLAHYMQYPMTDENGGD